jgi:hypothetical protein
MFPVVLQQAAQGAVDCPEGLTMSNLGIELFITEGAEAVREKLPVVQQGGRQEWVGAVDLFEGFLDGFLRANLLAHVGVLRIGAMLQNVEDGAVTIAGSFEELYQCERLNQFEKALVHGI